MQEFIDDQQGFYHMVVAKVMRRTAATTTQIDNLLTKRARKWKKDQGIIALTIGEMEELIKSKNLRIIAEQKVDGQSAILEFKDGVARFASLHDRVYDDLPVLDEIASTLKARDVSHALMVGEMAVSDNGKIVPFEESQSVIKGADRDKTRIHWYPYQIIEINGEEHGEGFETYLKGWKLIKDLFKGTQRVHPVESSEGGVPELQAAWKKMVEKEQNEGLVVRTSDGRVYKCKPEFTYDLVVIAVGDKKLRNWPKGLIGSTLMAFMDSDGVFRVAGEVGTGWTQAERGDLFKWAQQNKVGEDDRYVWVKPEKVMEVQFDRSVVRDVTSYKFSDGKYEKVEKRLGGTIIKPRFIRWRDDKKVTPEDLRLTQIPDWKEQKTAALVRKMPAEITQLLPQLVQVAQKAYDDWDQDDHGQDEELGSGGVCQDIAEGMSDVLNEHGVDASTVDSGGVVDQHVWVVAQTKEGVFTVDIEPRVYESGSGYVWKKRKGVKFLPSHIDVTLIDDDPSKYEQYTKEAHQINFLVAFQSEAILKLPDFRGEAWRVDTGFVHNGTAADVVHYEQEELRNNLGVKQKILEELKKYPAKDLIWVTKSEVAAQKYGENVDRIHIPQGSKVVAEDGDGGYLVLIKKEHLGRTTSLKIAGSIKDFKTFYMQRAVEETVNNSSTYLDEITPDRYFFLAVDRHGDSMGSGSTLSKQSVLLEVEQFKKNRDVRRIIVERPKRGYKEWVRNDTGEWISEKAFILDDKIAAQKIVGAYLDRAGSYLTAGISQGEIKSVLDSIGLPDRQGAYAIHGSSPLAAHGLIESGKDLDIIVTPELFEELKTKYPDNVGTSQSGSPQVLLHHGGVEVEIFKDWWGNMPTEKILRNAEKINGVWYASLDDVEEWKKLRFEKKHLPKDQMHLDLIRKYREKKADYPGHLAINEKSELSKRASGVRYLYRVSKLDLKPGEYFEPRDHAPEFSKPTIYIDMDEVLVDWSKAVREKLPDVIEGIPLDSGSEKRKKLVDAINSLGPTFWEDLEWAEGMKALWDELKPYNPIILTALRNHPYAREGKLRWLKKNLPDAHVIFEENKEKYSGQGKILIDDFQSNIDRWERAGGIGILHTDVSSTRRKLRPYLINTRSEKIKKTAEDYTTIAEQIKKADYPDHPTDVVLPGIKEVDVWNYYSGVKSKNMWRQREASSRVAANFMKMNDPQTPDEKARDLVEKGVATSMGEARRYVSAPGGYEKVLKHWQKRSKKADYPDHPTDVVLPGIKEVDIWNYYSGVKTKMLSELKGREMFIGIVPRDYRSGQKPVYIRHPYDKNTEYIRINNGDDFEVYHSSRTVEYHVTMPRMAPYYVIDFDAGDEPFSQTKKVTAEIADGLGKLPEVKSVEIRYTGKRGFHILGWLKKARDVDDARDFLKGWLKDTFGERNDVVIGESPSGKKGALGLSPMKENGGQVALWSLRVTGRCCVEVPRAGLMSFEKEDASLEKTYKKATGNAFSFGKMSKTASKLRKEVQKARDADLPVVFLGGLCDDSNAWRKEIIEEFSDRLYFLDPYDKDWDSADNIYDELAGMLTADYVVFYKGGKGSKHEQIFLDMVSEDAYAKFDDLDELKAYLDRISARVIEAFLQRSAVPFIGEPPQDIFLELMSHEDAVRILRDLKLGKEIYIPALRGYPERKISRRDITHNDWVNLHTFGYTKGSKNPLLSYENGHYIELAPAGILRTAGYDRELIKPGYRGQFVIHDHDADKAGRHWDLRLSFPVTSLAKALGHYEGKRTEETPEPGDTFPDEPGTVYRSFAVKKHHAPTATTKVFIVETEDHPISYGKFHGTIPEGEYGAGDVSIWDRGTYEIKDVEGDSKYVLEFHGKKLSGTYALVKYEKGYLWVKSKDEKKASVIDYVRPTLPVQIWDQKSLRLKPSVRAEILERLVSAYEEAGLHNPLKWVTELTISGSAAAYNYTDGGDLDIDISYDLNRFRGQNPGLAGLPQAAVLKLVRKAIGAKNDAPVNGSSFVYSFMVLEEGDDPSGDGLYDVFADRWLKVPVRPPLEFDPDKAFQPQRAAALTVCRMVDDIIRMILATVADLKKLDANRLGDTGRRVILMAELKALCSAIYSMHKQIWALQRDSKNPAVLHRYPAFDLSPNWDERMVIFKYIVRYGCHLPIHKLYDLIEDDPYFDTIDRFIPGE